TEEKIDALTFPNITVTKMAPENPVEFKMNIVSMPEISLPDYKKIAKSVEKEKNDDVSEKEIDEYIEYIRRQRAQGIAMAEGKKIDNDNLELPDFDDEFVK